MSSDPYNLQRFIDAQEIMYNNALAELKLGNKRSHWIWYIFPQTPKIGMGEKAQFYAIRTKAEAQAYIDHPLLGKRLVVCTQTILTHEDKSLEDIFDTALDVLKMRSCMMLFRHVDESGVFDMALEKYYDKKVR